VTKTGVLILADDLARIVDASRDRASGPQRIIKRGAGAAAEKEAVLAGGVEISPDDLPHIVDPQCLGGAKRGRRIVYGGVNKDRAVKTSGKPEEAVVAAAVGVIPDDVPAVDAACDGIKGALWGIVQGGVGAASENEAVSATALSSGIEVAVKADDIPCSVDPEWIGLAGGRLGIVD